VSELWKTISTGITSARDVALRGTDCSRCQAVWLLCLVLVIAAFTLSGEMLEKLLTLIAGGAIHLLGVGSGSKARGQGPEIPPGGTSSTATMTTTDNAEVDPNATRS